MARAWIKPEDTAFPESPYAQLAADYASYVLFRLTGEKYTGVMSAVETYTTTDRSIHENVGGTSTLSDSIARTIMVPRSVAYPKRLYLRGTPANMVNMVTQGDTVLDPNMYTLHNRRFLTLKSGDNWCFSCGDTGITVDYTYGMLPPQAGVLAATTLANELMLLLGEGQSENSCRIPERVRSIAREGISFDMIDPQEFLDDGRTGIWEVDLFIRTANPAKSKKQPRVLSPHDPRRTRSM